jgi:hypothetical protein
VSDATLFTFGFMVFMIAATAVIVYGYQMFWDIYVRGGERV